jgi:carboxypeptidase Taq
MANQLYQNYTGTLQKIADIKYAAAVLQWDQETYLPPNGAALRGQQIATLTEFAHQQFTTPQLGQLLAQLQQEKLTPTELANVKLTQYDYTKNQKLPAAFVRQTSEAINAAYHAWVLARKQNNYSIFETPLAKIITLKQQEADLLGYQHHPYNALLNDYDPGQTVANLDAVFNNLIPQLQTLIQKISAAPQVNNSFLQQHYPKAQQWQFGIDVLTQMGYNFAAGRQDISEHPFTINFNSQDVRITTRIDEQDFANMLWSCIHEGGHALYEQGLPNQMYGLPLGEYASLSIHESQSRLWENNLGRSLPFWQYWYPKLQAIFVTQLQQVSLQQFYNGINQVTPSLIRTEADELTYHLHVYIRYLLEKDLITGTLTAKDIPTAWAELYKKYLGVTPHNHAQGCLQDVHWSHGSLGYFATYSIGSLYAAQLFTSLNNNGISTQIQQGNYTQILNWLRNNIHQYGRQFTGQQLCTTATGQALNSQFFIQYATQKYSSIYGIAL